MKYKHFLAILRGLAAFSALLAVSSLAGTKPSAVNKPVVVIGEIKNESTIPDSEWKAILVQSDKFTYIETSSSEPAKAFFRSLRTRIETSIESTGKFTVSDRSAMREHEQEMDLVEMGIADGQGAPRDGNVRSVGFKVSGSVLMFNFNPGRSADMRLELHITDIDKQIRDDSKGGSQEVLVNYVPEGLGANVANSVLLDGILAECAQKITVRVLEYAFPPKILAVGTADVTVNIRDVQTEIGDLFDVCSTGEELFDPDTGESLGADEEVMGRVRIARPGPKFSKAVPVGKTPISAFEKGMILRRVDATQLEIEKDRRSLGR